MKWHRDGYARWRFDDGTIVERTSNPTALRRWYVQGDVSDLPSSLTGGYFLLRDAKVEVEKRAARRAVEAASEMPSLKDVLEARAAVRLKMIDTVRVVRGVAKLPPGLVAIDRCLAVLENALRTRG